MEVEVFRCVLTALETGAGSQMFSTGVGVVNGDVLRLVLRTGRCTGHAKEQVFKD
jgi:hypothetical protein